jgi:hypothetical protein
MEVIEFQFCSEEVSRCVTLVRVSYSPGRDRYAEEKKGKGPVVSRKRS